MGRCQSITIVVRIRASTSSVASMPNGVAVAHAGAQPEIARMGLRISAPLTSITRHRLIWADETNPLQTC